MNERLLSDLGITGNEAKIYKAVLKAGKLTPAVLAKTTGIKRTTAYHIAKSLVDRGMLVEDDTKRPRTFSLATPQDIEQLIDAEKKQFGAREKVWRELSGELSRLSVGAAYTVPTVRFVPEEKLERFFYAELPKWHESLMAADATWWGFQDHTFLEHFGKITAWYWKRSGQGLSVKLLSNQSETEAKIAGKYPRRAIKFWKKAGNFASTTWITGDYVIMVSTRQHPFYLVEIHDKAMAHDLREVFKNLWGLVP